MDNEVTLWLVIFGGNALLVCIMEGGLFAKYFVMGIGVVTIIAGFFFPFLWLLSVISVLALMIINRRLQNKDLPKKK